MKKFKKSFLQKLIIGILICVVTIGIVGSLYLKDVYQNRESYKDNLIRFHVIANSDSNHDQSLKIKVRDTVINEMDKKFESLNSINQTRQVIKQNLDEIKYIAKDVLKESGSDLNVEVFFGNYNFPTKSYGNFTLPAGEYEAVRVVLGEGKGKNWWCVMFPPLCFIDINHGITDEEAQNRLKEVLNDDEYNMIKSDKTQEDMPIKLKFKIVELIEENKLKFAKIFVSEANKN